MVVWNISVSGDLEIQKADLSRWRFRWGWRFEDFNKISRSVSRNKKAQAAQAAQAAQTQVAWVWQLLSSWQLAVGAASLDLGFGWAEMADGFPTSRGSESKGRELGGI